MKNNRITFAFSDTEKKMLDRLCETMGCNSSELFRSFVRDKYLKLFPPYIEKKMKVIVETEEFTDEQFCEKHGGSISGSPAGSICSMKVGASTVKMLASDRAAVLRNANRAESMKKLRNG